METKVNKNPVLVTGASGYIASWLVKYLLDDGYTVHGTVRSLENKDKIEHLLKPADDSEGKLKLSISYSFTIFYQRD